MTNKVKNQTTRIPNVYLINLDKLVVRKHLISSYGNPSNAYPAENTNGEKILISVNHEVGLTIRTFRENGDVYSECYDKNGIFLQRGINGRWK